MMNAVRIAPPPAAVQASKRSHDLRRVALPHARHAGASFSAAARRGTCLRLRATSAGGSGTGEPEDQDAFANGRAVNAGEGMSIEADQEDAGSAALELIDVAVSAAASNGKSVLKGRLLRAVAGVDRGVAASASDVDVIEDAVQALESASRDEETSERIDERISGKWRLVYSSTFAGKRGGSQGFTGSPGSGTPLRLGAVYQRIQPRKQKVDNIVEISLPAPVPFAPPLKASATLSHTLEVTGDRTIRIDFDSITFRPQGLRVPLRPITLPSPFKALQLPQELRGGAFDTTFADSDIRISRGDRGELRIFVRA